MNGHVQDLLSAYLDGELSPPERSVVEAHLAACEVCAAQLEGFAAVDGLVRAAPLDAPEDYFETFPQRVRARLRPRADDAPARWRVPVWGWAVAAALVLAVLTPLTLREAPSPWRARVAAPEPARPPATPTPGTRYPSDAQAGQAKESDRLASARHAQAERGDAALELRSLGYVEDRDAGRAGGAFARPPAEGQAPALPRPAAPAPGPGPVPAPTAPSGGIEGGAGDAPGIGVGDAPAVAAPARAWRDEAARDAESGLEKRRQADARTPSPSPGLLGGRAGGAPGDGSPPTAPGEAAPQAAGAPAAPATAAPAKAEEARARELAAGRERETGATGPAPEGAPFASTDRSDRPPAAVPPATETAAAASRPAVRTGAVSKAALALSAEDEFAALRARAAELAAATLEEARALRDDWRSFAARNPAGARGDEARWRVIESGDRAWRLGRHPRDRAVLVHDARTYLDRKDGAHGERVRTILDEAHRE